MPPTGMQEFMARQLSSQHTGWENSPPSMLSLDHLQSKVLSLVHLTSLTPVPIIHIVGAPSTAQQNSRLILHHTLGTPVFDVFLKAYSLCSAACVSIDAFTTGAHIDRAIETCLHRNLPIYILLPQDMVSHKISMEPLSRPLNIQLHTNDEEEREEFYIKYVRF